MTPYEREARRAGPITGVIGVHEDDLRGDPDGQVIEVGHGGQRVTVELTYLLIGLTYTLTTQRG